MTNKSLDMDLIKLLSIQEKKTLMERFVKLSEECGELAQELLISAKASGSQHKAQGEDGILGEAVDVTLVALSIFFCAGGTADELTTMAQAKCAKWQRFQQR
jgi:hypothetical protein